MLIEFESAINDQMFRAIYLVALSDNEYDCHQG